MVDPELVKTAKRFVQGKLSLGDLDAWLAGIDYDDPELSEESKEAAATLRLLCIEVGEGLRPAKELREEARLLAAASTRSSSLI